MSKHGLRQQKQLAKKKAKRTERRTQLAQENSNDPKIRLAAAASWPVFAALVPQNLWTQGIGQLLIVRRMPDGRLACGVFLVDIYSLGVKNAFWTIQSMAEYRAFLSKVERVAKLKAVAPEFLAKLVRDATAYAQSFGFAPHADFHHASLLLAGIDPSLCSEQFTFGKDGKPFYIRGPHESLKKAREIAGRITAAGGHYVIPTDEFDAQTMEVQDLHGDQWPLEHHAWEDG